MSDNKELAPELTADEKAEIEREVKAALDKEAKERTKEEFRQKILAELKDLEQKSDKKTPTKATKADQPEIPSEVNVPLFLFFSFLMFGFLCFLSFAMPCLFFSFSFLFFSFLLFPP